MTNLTQIVEHNITSSGQTAIDVLSQACANVGEFSRAELKQFFAKGAVWLTSNGQKPQRVRRVKKILSIGDYLTFYYNPDVLNANVTPPTLILDKTQYSLWLKPRGMLSQGSKWGDHTALYRWVEMNYQAEGESQSRQAWLVHRLDRATAGLQLLAHSKKMAHTLTQLFENRQIQKRYQAIVHGHFPAERQTMNGLIDERSAITHAQLLQFDATHNLSLMEVEIETGRKHQIRKHLSQAGYPILGDRLYGNETLDATYHPQRPNLQLSAYKLAFTCPITQMPMHIKLETGQLDLITLSD